MENEHLFMSVYPYEVALQHLNVQNDNGFGGASIVYEKKVQKKLKAKGSCQDQTIQEFIGCIRAELRKALQKSTVQCMVPALNFTDFDTSHLEYCQSPSEALAVENLIYELAQKTQLESLCRSQCRRVIYENIINYYSERVLAKELASYGEGYFITWAFYSTLYVNEANETYIFDFDSALVAVGGSLGLFLGWSAHSLIMGFVRLMAKLKRTKIASEPT